MKLPTHVVAAGGLVRRPNGDVLLVKSERRGWEFPGGVVEPGESLPQAVMREVREESGVTARPIALVGIYSNTSTRPGYGDVEVIPTIVNVDFLLEYQSGELATSEETIDVGWFTEAEARQLVTYPKYVERFENMLRAPSDIVVAAFRDPYEWIDKYTFCQR